jgi:hypothetical protein
VIAEGELVAVHSNYKTWNMAGVDIFRLNDDGNSWSTGTSFSKFLRRPLARTTCSRSSARATG